MEEDKNVDNQPVEDKDPYLSSKGTVLDWLDHAWKVLERQEREKKESLSKPSYGYSQPFPKTGKKRKGKSR